MPEYKIILETKEQDLETSINPVDIENAADDKIEGNEKKKKKKKKEKDPNPLLTSLYKAQSAISLAEPIISSTVATVAQRYQLTGETLKAQRLNTSYSNISQATSLGLGLGITLITGNPLAIAATAYQLAQRAYQLNLETRRFVFERSQEQYKQQYLSQRIVRHISEVR